MGAPRLKGGIGADGPYWDALDEGRFRLPRCADCRRWMWPAHHRCGACGGWEMAWQDVEPIGILYAWTRNHLVSDLLKEWRADLPYLTALIELPQAGGARVAGVLAGVTGDPRIGQAVSGTIVPASGKSRGFATMTWSPDDAGAVRGAVA